MAKVGRPKAEEPTKDHKLSVRMTDENYNRVKGYADRNHTSITHVIEDSVDEYLTKRKA